MPINLPDLYRQTCAARKVLVVDFGFLGDTIHLAPALWELHRHYPHAELHVLTTPLGAEVLSLVAWVKRAWAVELHPQKRTLGQQWQTVRALRQERFDLAVNFSGADRTLFWTALIGAKQAVAQQTNRRHFWNRWLVPNWVPQPAPDWPVFEQRRQFLQACGLQLLAPNWELSIPEAIRDKAASAVTGHPIHFSICASTPLKEWPLENFVELAKLLLGADPQLQLVATAGSNTREQTQLRAFAAAVGQDRLRTITGRTITELAGVLKLCRLHVGADSGVLHLAMALGLPTVSIFRDYHDASAWMPTGPAHQVFKMPCQCVNQSEQPCALTNRAACLGQLPVETIAAAVHAIAKPPGAVGPSPAD